MNILKILRGQGVKSDGEENGGGVCESNTPAAGSLPHDWI